MSVSTPFGPNTSGIKRLIRREIIGRAPTLLGTVISRMRLVDSDAAGSATWVVDVDIGSGVPLYNVPVKGGADGGRDYAALGQTIALARNAQGRVDAIGPGDRITTNAKVKKYNLGNSTPVSESNQGLTAERVPYSYYQGPTPGVPGTSRWNDQVTPYPFIRIVDGDGNPV